MRGLTPSCRVKVNAAGDWQILPPAGQITQIGDAGATTRGLVNNDDLFISGKLETAGIVYFRGAVTFLEFFAAYGSFMRIGSQGDHIEFLIIEEILTIPVGQGAAGVATAANLAPANSTIESCMCLVTQAPGGGATTIDIGRTGGGNLDEFIDGIGTALDTSGTFAANHDAATLGPVLNAADDTLTLTTDANVTGTDMIVRIVVYYRQEVPPTS